MPKVTEQQKKGKIGEFFSDNSKLKKSTVSGYNSAFWGFFRYTLKLSADDKKNLSDHVDRYFATHDTTEIHADLKLYLKEEISARAPLGALQVYNQLQNFFSYTLDVPFSGKQLKSLRNQIPEGGVQSQTTHFNNDMIRQMMQYTDVKGRALLLMLSSSGMRPGEALKLKCSDVHFPTTEIPYTWLYIRDPKNKHSRHTHCSTEATAAIREWIKVRSAYISENKNRGLKLKNRTAPSGDDDRLFPMSSRSLAELLEGCVTKAFGKNEKDLITGHSLIHAHGFRKFFETRLLAVVPHGYIKAMAGQLTNLEKTYINLTPEQTVQEYAKGEHLLWVESVPEIREAATENLTKIAQIEEAEKQLTRKSTRLENENAELLDRVNRQGETIASLQREHEGANRELTDRVKKIEDLQKMILELVSDDRVLGAIESNYHNDEANDDGEYDGGAAFYKKLEKLIGEDFEPR